MKILIVSHVIFPFQSPRSFRSTELAKEFSKLGNNVTIYTNKGEFDYREFEQQFNLKVNNFNKLLFIRKKSSGKETYTLIEKVLIKFFRRLLFYPNIEFLFNIRRTLKYEKNFDLLLSIGAPHSIHWGCAWALKKNPQLAKKWIADCGDPFMGNKHENPPFYFKYLEKWFCRRVDNITVPIEGAKAAYFEEFRNKITVIPQGFNFNDVNLYQEKIENKVPTFCYAGMVYKDKRDPSELLDFLCSLDLEFKFIVYTADTVIFPAYKEKLGHKIEILNYISRIDLIYNLSKMDFLINIENINKEQAPSKIIDYALTKRPILDIPSKNIDKNVIIEFLKSSYQQAKSVKLDEYNIETVSKKFLKLL